MFIGESVPAHHYRLAVVPMGVKDTSLLSSLSRSRTFISYAGTRRIIGKFQSCSA